MEFSKYLMDSLWLQTCISCSLSSFDFQSWLILAVLQCKIGSIHFFRTGVTHHSDLKFFFGFCLLYTHAIGINFPFCDSSTSQKRSILEIVSRATYLLQRLYLIIPLSGEILRKYWKFPFPLQPWPCYQLRQILQIFGHTKTASLHLATSSFEMGLLDNAINKEQGRCPSHWQSLHQLQSQNQS